MSVILKDSCLGCGDVYYTNKAPNSNFCSPKCNNSCSHSFEYVNNILTSNGYTVLSTEYINEDSVLECLCPKKHHISFKWMHFSRALSKGKYFCKYCNKKNKPTIEEVTESFDIEGYTLLETEYKDAFSKMKYRCHKGHEHSMSWSNWNHKRKFRCPTCWDDINMGEGNSQYKGGVTKLDVPLYSTYAPQLSKYEYTECIKNHGLDLLGVKCVYCSKVFVPNIHQTVARVIYTKLEVIKPGLSDGRFYCSDGCKQACPMFNKQKYPEGYAPATSREMQPQFRKMVLERDLWTCQKCDAKDTELHAHHIEPVINNPIESCDVDNGITLCNDCHTEVHKLPGCGLQELKCVKE